MEQFLRDLAQLKHQGWRLGLYFQLRNSRCDCPGAAILKYSGYNTGIHASAPWISFGTNSCKLIGLYPHQARAIMAAADNWDGHDATLRRRMLEAVGLWNNS